jgi:hypothetical protein
LIIELQIKKTLTGGVYDELKQQQKGSRL